MREKERPALEKSEIVFSEPTGKLANNNEGQGTESIKVAGKVNKRFTSKSLSNLILRKAMELVEKAEIPKALLQSSINEQVPANKRKQTLPLGAAMTYAQPSAAPKTVFNLIHKKTGELIEISSGLTIGAGTDVDYTVEDNAFMSREHAKLKVEGNALLIKDLGSLNGTFLNGDKINKFTVRIKSGDSIKLADEEFLVQ